MLSQSPKDSLPPIWPRFCGHIVQMDFLIFINSSVLSSNWTEFNNYDWISQAWLNFTSMTESRNCDCISQLWLDFTISTEFHNFNWISQYQLNFIFSTEFRHLNWISQFGQPCYYAIPGSLEGLEADLDGFAEAGHICPSPWPVCPAGEGLRQSPYTLQGLCNRLPFNLSHSCNVVKWELFVEVWQFFV